MIRQVRGTGRTKSSELVARFTDRGVAVFPPSAMSVFLTEAHGSPRNSFAVVITELEPHGDRITVRAGERGQLSADITPEATAELDLAPE